MASILVQNLNQNGLSLFEDHESYLNELQESELTSAYGGVFFTIAASPTIGKGLAVLGVAATGFAAGVGFTNATRTPNVGWWR